MPRTQGKYKCADCDFRSNTISGVSVHALVHTPAGKSMFMDSDMVAKTLAASRPHGMDANTLFGAIPQWKLMCESIADFCQSQNAQFDRERFLAACGVTA